MKCVAVVPMKLNNSRLPNKNIKSFKNGEPLCTYILNTLKKIKEIDEIYVYCSDCRIKEYFPPHIKYLSRKEEFDSDSTKMNDILKAFADKVNADIYVMTHATSPFISSESIRKGIRAVMEGEYDSSFAVKKIQDFIWKDNKPFNYQLNQIPRTQDLEALYMETSGFYIYKNNVIKDYGRRIGEMPFLVEVDEMESIDIDEKQDFEIADAIFNHIFLK